jgi:hypothetical protein
MFINGSGRMGTSIDTLSFGSFGLVVSEEIIKNWKVHGRWTTEDGWQVMAKTHIGFGKVS